jgi:tetratricopeptide (TPR) repeat protein
VRMKRLQLLLILLALFYALVAGLKTVADFDLGWQMATGRYSLNHFAIPRTALFSYTAAGVEWIYPAFSGILFYLLYHAGGYAAISWLVALACVGCVAVLTFKRDFYAVLLVLLAVPVFSSEIMPRASLFTMVLFTCFARIMVQHFENRQAPLWLLPLLMLFWVNLHTGFIAGYALMAAYLIIEALEIPFSSRRAAAISRVKQSIPWLICAALITVLNPWGVRIFAAISRQQAVVRGQSVSLEEWEPVQLARALHELGWRNPESALWWLLSLGGVLAAVCLWRKRLGPALVLVVAVFAFLRHQRMEGPCIVLICLIGGSLLTNAATGDTQLWRRPNLALLVASLFTVLVAVRSFDLITNKTYLASGDVTLFGPGQSWWLPERATGFLLQDRLPVQLFSNFNLGSYLVWRVGEHYPDFADGRYLPFGDRLIEQQRLLTSRPLDSQEWTEAAETYHISLVIFPLSRVFALGEFPLSADCASTRWTPIYMDVSAIVFQRKASQEEPLLTAVDCRTHNLLAGEGGPVSSIRQRAEQYQTLANASAIYSQLGRLGEAWEAAEEAERIFSGDMTLYLIKGQTAAAGQQYNQAEQAFRTALRIRQTDAGWYNLALVFISEHHLPEAVDALLQSAHLSRQAYARQLLLARIYLEQHQPQPALDVLTQAARGDPYGSSDTPAAAEFRAQVAEGRAAAFLQLGQPQRAIELQRFAVHQTPGNARRRQVLMQDCQAAQIPCSL